jgi:uncharacterized protein (DUF1800 family)
MKQVKTKTTTTHEWELPHLYQRAGFGLSPAEWNVRKTWTRATALEELFRASGLTKASLPVPDAPFGDRRPNMVADKERSAILKEERQRVAQYNADWVRRMGGEPSSALLERMSLFWHGHFACESKIGQLAIQQLNCIRQHALGNFRDLALAITKDPAMIRYLNNQQNKKNQPNENFARELMELFTLGRGQYTEQDIKEAARAFTGWSSNLRGEFVFRARQHDTGSKTFMGKTGSFDGADIIDIILEKPEAAVFITRKIYRYFVNETVEEERVAELAHHFYQSDYDIQSLMWEIFSSDWFYAKENHRNKIKSPVELIAGILRQLGVSEIEDTSLVGLQRALGQVLFKPPNVAGWPGGQNWIDNSTLMVRIQLAGALYKASEVGFRFKEEPEQEGARQLRRLQVKVDWEPLYKMVEGMNETEALDVLADYLLAGGRLSVKPEVVLQYVSRENREAFVQTLCIRLMSLPEYQLC